MKSIEEPTNSGVFDTSKSPLDKKFFAIEVNGSTIDIGLLNFSDRLLVILTEYGKFGTFISARNLTGLDAEIEPVYELKTLFGDDRLDYTLAARALAEAIGIGKPLLFSIALRELSFSTIQILRKAIQENKIW